MNAREKECVYFSLRSSVWPRVTKATLEETPFTFLKFWKVFPLDVIPGPNYSVSIIEDGCGKGFWTHALNFLTRSFKEVFFYILRAMDQPVDRWIEVKVRSLGRPRRG